MHLQEMKQTNKKRNNKTKEKTNKKYSDTIKFTKPRKKIKHCSFKKEKKKSFINKQTEQNKTKTREHLQKLLSVVLDLL